MKKIIVIILSVLLLSPAGCVEIDAPNYTDSPLGAITSVDTTPQTEGTDMIMQEESAAPDEPEQPEEAEHPEDTIEPEESVEPVIIRDISAFFGNADTEAAMQALIPLLKAASVTAYHRVQGNEPEPTDITEDTYVLEALYHYMGECGASITDAVIENGSVTLPLHRAEALTAAMFLGREGLPDIPGEWSSILAYNAETRTLTACDYISSGLEISLTGTAYDTEAEQLLVTLDLHWTGEENPAFSLIVTLLRAAGSDTGAMIAMVDIG
ncbi:MAG: hypothetical protein ACOX17_04025 [Christensenellales bacterium]|jgi:hypothetical protein